MILLRGHRAQIEGVAQQQLPSSSIIFSNIDISSIESDSYTSILYNRLSADVDSLIDGIIKYRSNTLPMSMDKPNQSYPPPAQATTSVSSVMPLYLPDPSIKGVSFDQLLNQRGIRFMHSKAVPCPNVLTVDNNAHLPNCTFCDDSGIMYYGDEELWGVFSGNSIEKTFEAHGVWEIGTAVVTFPTEYKSGGQADFNTYDRLVIPDFTVRMYEMKEYEPRTGNIQTLRYPIQHVEFASSIRNNVQKIFEQGVDFTISTDGDIVWVFGKEPFYDAATGHGEVIIWSFFANPVYIVVQSLRELRITQELVNGQKVARRLPQQILIRRDFMVGPGEKI